jgi:hypothetical protein
MEPWGTPQEMVSWFEYMTNMTNLYPICQVGFNPFQTTLFLLSIYIDI